MDLLLPQTPGASSLGALHLEPEASQIMLLDAETLGPAWTSELGPPSQSNAISVCTQAPRGQEAAVSGQDDSRLDK